MIGNVTSQYGQKDQASAIAYVSATSVKNEQFNDASKSQEVKKDKNQSTKVTISDEALKKLGLEKDNKNSDTTQSTSGIGKLSDEEMKKVKDLKSRDSEVRSHEMAHMTVGGNLVRKGASYQYQTGPDGQRYAVGGEVSIDSSAVNGDPSATIIKMEQVKRAALAPANPSTQDRQVAAAAAETEAAARQQLLEQSTANLKTSS